MNKIKGYYGNKGLRNILPNLINEIPPHDEYVELFLGSGGLGRHLRLPVISLGVEINSSVVQAYKNVYPAGMVVINDCAIKWLKMSTSIGSRRFIYADPPYVRSVRRSAVDLYDYEISEDQHVELAQLLTSTTAAVMISGYPSKLYDKLYAGWRTKTFRVSVHGKIAIEKIWMNYPQPQRLHQYDFLGKNKTDRQRIKRKLMRTISRLSKLHPYEQQAIVNHINSKFV